MVKLVPSKKLAQNKQLVHLARLVTGRAKLYSCQKTRELFQRAESLSPIGPLVQKRKIGERVLFGAHTGYYLPFKRRSENKSNAGRRADV